MHYLNSFPLIQKAYEILYLGRNYKALSTLLIMYLTIGPYFVNHISAQKTGYQVLSRSEAVQMALSNHPIIQNGELKKAFKNTGKWPKFGLTEINYRYGQLYSMTTGSYFEFIQHFGSPMQMMAEKQYQSKAQQASEIELAIAKKQIEREVKKGYNQWIYAHHQFNLLQQKKQWYDDFIRITDLHYKQGAFDLLMKTKADAKYALVRSNYLQAQDNILLAENQLKQILLLDGDIIPETEELTMYEITKDTASGIYHEINHLEQMMEVRDAEIALEKAEIYPDVTAGYFHQRLGSEGFDGIHVGLALPLWFFSVKKNVNEARLSKELIVNKYEARLFQTEKEKVALRAKMNKYFKQIQYYKQYALKKADVLIQSSQLKFEKEDIEYFEHVENLSLGMEIKLDYLEIIKKYNEKAIELEYYVK